MNTQEIVTAPVAPPPATDGRRARTQRTRDKLLWACRRLMAAGVYRPPVLQIASHAGRCTRSVFEHFGDLNSLYSEALADPVTLACVAEKLPSLDPPGVARLLVLGELP